MLGKSLLIVFAVALAAGPGAAEPGSAPIVGGSQAQSGLNSHSEDYGYYPGRRSFYNYPRHRHIDGRADDGGSVRRTYGSNDDPHIYDRNYGSAYYGPNYGAPYFGGGYYQDGIYYRERRD